MTRSHKLTDRNHAGLANGTAAPEDHLPKYFGKAGYAGESPSNTKKQGGGKGNWYVRSRNSYLLISVSQLPIPLSQTLAYIQFQPGVQSASPSSKTTTTR